ncbi:MAG: hypothetical protein R3Y58_11735 [Eubacteriales bacterium]
MFKPTKLLKVISVLFIISGVLGVLSSITGPAIIEWSESVTGISTGVEITMLDTVLGVIGSLVTLAAGILGVAGKQYKVAWILAIIYVIYTIYGIISTLDIVGFSALSMMNFILPALYMWGLYCSSPELIQD